METLENLADALADSGWEPVLFHGLLTLGLANDGHVRITSEMGWDEEGNETPVWAVGYYHDDDSLDAPEWMVDIERHVISAVYSLETWLRDDYPRGRALTPLWQ